MMVRNFPLFLLHSFSTLSWQLAIVASNKINVNKWEFIGMVVIKVDSWVEVKLNYPTHVKKNMLWLLAHNEQQTNMWETVCHSRPKRKRMKRKTSTNKLQSSNWKKSCITSLKFVLSTNFWNFHKLTHCWLLFSSICTYITMIFLDTLFLN